MLVLSRKVNETIVINGEILVTVLSIRGNHIRLGIQAPHSVGILRHELWLRTQREDEPDEPAAPEVVGERAVG
jgi:carbon storage regulator